MVPGVRTFQTGGLWYFPQSEDPGTREYGPLDLYLRHLSIGKFASGFDEEQLAVSLHTSRDSLTTRLLSNFTPDSSIYGDKSAAEHLVSYFTANEFPNPDSLAISYPQDYQEWLELIAVFPALASLEIEAFTLGAVTILGACATIKFEIHSFIPPGIVDDHFIIELDRVIRLPSLAGLRRLNLASMPLLAFGTSAGLDLLQDFEERGITLPSRYGSLSVPSLFPSSRRQG